MFEIEKGVNMPSLGKRGRKPVYPFLEMKQGDSFFVEGKTPSQMGSVAYNWSKRHSKDIKFVVKKENNGTRVWRFI